MKTQVLILCLLILSDLIPCPVFGLEQISPSIAHKVVTAQNLMLHAKRSKYLHASAERDKALADAAVVLNELQCKKCLEQLVWMSVNRPLQVSVIISQKIRYLLEHIQQCPMPFLQNLLFEHRHSPTHQIALHLNDGKKVQQEKCRALALLVGLYYGGTLPQDMLNIVFEYLVECFTSPLLEQAKAILSLALAANQDHA